ncbi:MAG: LamG domain-containing protein [Candidatus Bathyarchaeota archaeon]|nr:LamG domain-containing protein [Candidatus Bathyarchaeota archaeon]
MNRYQWLLVSVLLLFPLIAYLANAPIVLAQATNTPTPTATPMKSAEWKQNLVGCWSLDESSGTRYDMVGPNHLTDVNTVGSVTGKFSNAAWFDSTSNEHLVKMNPIGLNINNSNITIAAWVYPTGTFVSYMTVVAMNNFTNGWRMYLNRWDPPTINVSYSMNSWALLIVSINYENSQIIFSINNIDSVGIPVSIDTSGFNFYIGRTGGWNYFFNGYIDEVAIWHRALTSGDRYHLYNNGTGLSCYQLLAEGTPTPTPTPSGSMKVELSSGDWMTIDRSINYGQIATVIVISGLLLLAVVYLIVRFGRQWL